MKVKDDPAVNEDFRAGGQLTRIGTLPKIEVKGWMGSDHAIPVSNQEHRSGLGKLTIFLEPVDYELIDRSTRTAISVSKPNDLFDFCARTQLAGKAAGIAS
jgi:hypothetical protein